MSVSDPLLKRLKGYVKDLRIDPDPIYDDHASLQPFCETLELIFRKGLRQTNSIFARNRKDYWNWIEAVMISSHNNNERINPIFSMVISDVSGSGKIITSQGRGRYFLRLALQKKTLCVPVEHIIRNYKLLQAWYDPEISIIGDEILSEILMSVLFEATEINFKMNVKNCSFLDETWTLPVYKQYEFVPCKDLGINIQFIDGRAVVATVDSGSVAEEDNKIQPGDVLEELLGESLRSVRKGKIAGILRQNQGFPVYISVVKCQMKDESIFRPIAELLKKVGKDVASLQRVLDDDERRRWEQEQRVPPHALLPEDEYEEVPVHNSGDAAVYPVEYVGRIEVGQDGGVGQIEGAINATIKRNDNTQSASLQLGETNVFVTDTKTKKEILRHSYTEISSCGRRVDNVEYFAYIAGETTCTLAKQFVAYVFRTKCDEESKTILCTIAQGFGRTHWYV